MNTYLHLTHSNKDSNRIRYADVEYIVAIICAQAKENEIARKRNEKIVKHSTTQRAPLIMQVISINDTRTLSHSQHLKRKKVIPKNFICTKLDIFIQSG